MSVETGVAENKEYSKPQFQFYTELYNIVKASEKECNKALYSKSIISKMNSTNNLGKAIDYEKFDGGVTSDPLQFINHTESVFKLRKIKDDEEKCVIFSLLMKPQSPASHWFNRLAGSYNGALNKASVQLDGFAEQKSQVATSIKWDQLKAEFVKRWVRDNDQQVRVRLNQLYMSPNQNVEEFAEEFQAVTNQIRNPPMGDRELLDAFITRLTPDLVSTVRMNMPQTFEKAYELAVIAEGNQSIIAASQGNYGPRSFRRANGAKGIAVNAVSESKSVAGLDIDQFTELIKKAVREEVETVKTRMDKLEKDFGSFKSYASKAYMKKPYQNATGSSGAPANLTCFRCNKPGHYAAQCPQGNARSPNDTSKTSTGGNYNRFNKGLAAAKVHFVDKVNADEFEADEADSNYLPSDVEEESNSNPILVVEPKVTSETVNATTSAKAESGSKASPLMSEVKVGNVDTNAIVDTGSAKSLISSKLFNELSERWQSQLIPLKEIDVNLKSATGNELKRLGTIKLPVAFGSQSVGKLEFVVIENLHSKVIIGMDMLMERFGPLDIKEQELVYLCSDKSKSPVKIKLKPPRKKDLYVGSIYLSKRVVIPPSSEVEIGAIVDTHIKGLGHFRDTVVASMKKDNHANYKELILCVVADDKTAQTLKPGLKLMPSVSVATDAVLNIKQSVPVRIINKTKQPIVIRANTRLGKVEALDQSQIQSLKY